MRTLHIPWSPTPGAPPLRPVFAGAILVLTLVGLACWPVTPAHAQVLPLPAGAYPSHTRLTYYPDWTNRQFDCNFGWFCDGVNDRPFLHLLTQDALHRMSGWAVWGEWQGDRMGFELYSSVYSDQQAPDSVPWNRHASADEQLALLGLRQARAARTTPMLLPDGVQGGTFAASVDRPGWHVLFLTVWWGPEHEVEAAALYPPREKGRARRYLAEQVREAVRASER